LTRSPLGSFEDFVGFVYTDRTITAPTTTCHQRTIGLALFMRPLRCANPACPWNLEKETEMKRLHAYLLGALLGLSMASNNASAQALKVDTLSGQTPGHLIGCNYTFKNGSPSIPCPSNYVAADGIVRFIKPNAPFDNIEYWDLTAGKPLAAFFNPINVPINDTLVAGTQYPILRAGNNVQVASFFDVFFEINLPLFDGANLERPGAFDIGDTLQFLNGLNTDGFAGISVPNYTGTAVVVGFDMVSIPEPASIALVALGLCGLALSRRRQQLGAAGA
jgi:hypothetical protein